MYIPEHYRMPEPDVAAFLAETRTGTLVTVAAGRPVATFLPWTLVDGDRLTSHLALVNPQAAADGEALVILMGADAYVSDEWMGDGAAPTWDYETVHLVGDLTLHRDPDWIISSWDDLLRRFSHRTAADYDPSWLERTARAVVGVEFRIREVQAKSKLSQKESAATVRSIADHLAPACPRLSARLEAVSLPHIAARDERVQAARPYTRP
ncbi:MAG: FMN-binding negative transcriptional regulator [Propionibacteriaceae bacterium]|jgi:transcriptional regulator|nr:FMN-binding negative transcriptional regulator [Propionibacteriaceae bacterium]